MSLTRWSIRSGRSLLVAVAVLALGVAACNGSGQEAESQATSTGTVLSTDPGSTSGPRVDAERVLQDLEGDGLRFEASDAPVAVAPAWALQAAFGHLHGGALEAPTKEVILAEVVNARSSSSLVRGQLVYVVYVTGFEEYDPGPMTEAGTPAVGVTLTQAAVILDANTGDFIWSSWWE